jgi:chlorite dismutase
MPENLTELSAIAIIFIFFLKEFFSYLRARKNGGVNNEIQLALINQKLDNHIKHISEAMDEMKNDMARIKDEIVDIKIKLK